MGAVGILAILGMMMSVGLNFWVGFGLGTTTLPARTGLLVERVVRLVVTVVVGSIATGGITHVVASDLEGRDPGIADTLAAGLRLALPLLGLSVVTSLGVGLASLLLVFPGFMLVTRWFVAAPARVVDVPSLEQSLARSADLTAGSRWRIFGLFLVIMVLVVVVGAPIGFSIGLISARSTPAIREFIGSTAQLVAATSGRCIYAAAAVCYMELRRIRGGLLPGRLDAVFA